MKPGLKSLLIAGLLANAAIMAQAQTTTAPAASKPQANHERGMHDSMDPAKREAMVTKHLADLKTKLKITAPQEGAWTTFTAALKPPARAEHTRPDRAEMEKLTTPERIDKMRAHQAQRMTEMQAQRDKREEATKVFYTGLNADQKKVFDAEHSKMVQRWGDCTGHGATAKP